MTNSFGIYVHLPFCFHRCSYCDFFSATGAKEKDFVQTAEGIIRELEAARAWLDSQWGLRPTVTSVFLGGGTPSLFPVREISKILKCIKTQFGLEDCSEISLEANPETVSMDFAKELKNHTPINRISMGVQSFQAKYLSLLERKVQVESIPKAFETLSFVGYSNMNLDFIFGIPGQTKAEALDDIKRAVELGPTHISAYQLTLKPGHALYSQLPTDDEGADLYEAIVQALWEAGYGRYEISNFSKPGFECRHNLLYWSGGDYLGVGPSAASRFFHEGVFHHRKAPASQEGWSKSKFPEPGFETTTREQTRLEAVFLELRRTEGVSLKYFRQRYGYDPLDLPKFGLYQKEGILATQGDNLRLTDRGLLLADSVALDL